MPRYLRNRLGEAESTLRLFLLEVPTRILYIETNIHGRLTFCAASNRVPQLLRSALWNHRRTGYFNLWHAGRQRETLTTLSSF